MARKAHRVHASARDTFGSMLRLLLVFLPLAASSNTNTSITATNATANGLKLSQVEGKNLFRSLRASTCTVDCSQAKVEYVCGTDDVTYTSKCELQRAKQCDGKRANGSRIKMRSKGRCPGDTEAVSKCFREREEARNSVNKREFSDVLIPSCNEDGTYSEIQCHKTTRYCWCVTKDGRHITGTSIRESRPQCKGKKKKRKGRNSKKKKKRKECTSKERQSFNADLVKVFREEYERMVAARGKDAVSDAAPTDEDVSKEKKIVVWKFSQMDTNSDSVLTFKEIRIFRRMMKKLIKPRRCAKGFHRYCDKDNDRRIQKNEWTLCLGVDIKISFRIFMYLNSEGHTTEAPTDKPRDDPRPLTPATRPLPSLSPLSSRPKPAHIGKKNRTDSTSRNCMDERQSALTNAREEPTANIYIPRCQPNGLWKQAQCHEATQYCWCVEEESGNPVPGTSTYKVEPNCTIRDDREMKGCPFEHKRRFIVDLMNDMTKEMNSHNSSSQTSSETEQFSARERVARWQYHHLDKNKNGNLERQEWRDLRRTLKKNKDYPRKCRRQFLRYCDGNDDKILTLEEWRDCLGLNHNLFNSLPENPKRQGQKNPFMDQLT